MVIPGKPTVARATQYLGRPEPSGFQGASAADPWPDEPYESVSLTSSWPCGNNHSRKSLCSDFGHISGVSPGNCGPQLFACWPSLSATPAEVPTDLNEDSDGVGGVVRRAVNVAIRA